MVAYPAKTRSVYLDPTLDSMLTTLFSPGFLKEFGTDYSCDRAFNAQTSYPYNILSFSNKETGSLEKIVAEFALAGFEKEDIKVLVVEDELQISATDKEKEAEANKEIEVPYKYLHHGISKRQMKIAFKLGTKMDKDSIKSTFKNGMLNIEILAKKDLQKEITVE